MAPNASFEPDVATEIKYVPGKGDKRFQVDPNQKIGYNW